jgi:hypothetical protein
MPPGRNSPCLCGSGRKYKSCCLRGDLEREAERMLADPGYEEPDSESLYVRPEMREELKASARRDGTWEVGVIPLPSSIETDPEARLVIAMAATLDAVLAMNVLTNLSGEPAEVAVALHEVLEEAMRLTGARPRFLHVAHPETARELAPLLAGCGIEVEALGGYDRLHDPARSMMEDMAGVDLWPPMSKPVTWAAWQLPDADVAALFRAAAAFFRAAPWSILEGDDVLGFALPEGPPWAGVIMGQAREVYGLALYAQPSDVIALFEGGAARQHQALGDPGAMEGRIITLIFEKAHELPRPMRREVARRGWEVASPSAYPTLVAVNTPGGGVSRADVRALTEALSLVPAYLEAAENSDPSGAFLPEWTSPETGTVVYPVLAAGPIGPPPTLLPGHALGPGARPGAFLALKEKGKNPTTAFEKAYRAGIDVVTRFGSSLDREGMGESTIMTHVKNAAAFVWFLTAIEGVPLAGLHERDLRTFLLDWHPRNHEGGRTRARRMPVSLDRFFHFLDRDLGLHCPWAAEVLEDRELIELRLETAPPGSFEDPEVLAWRTPFLEDMTQRLLRPNLEELHESMERLNPERATNLLRELIRSWLVWRDELIEARIPDGEGDGADADEIAELLLRRQRSWVEEKGVR